MSALTPMQTRPGTASITGIYQSKCLVKMRTTHTIAAIKIRMPREVRTSDMTNLPFSCAGMSLAPKMMGIIPPLGSP
jgi:hypothetical protein